VKSRTLHLLGRNTGPHCKKFFFWFLVSDFGWGLIQHNIRHWCKGLAVRHNIHPLWSTVSIVVHIGTKLEGDIVFCIIDPVAIIETPQLLRIRTIIADCQICNANLVIVTREERRDTCDNVNIVRLDNTLVINGDKNLATDWAPMNLHNIIVPGLNLRKLNEMHVVKVLGCGCRNVDAVKVHLEGEGRRRRMDGVEGDGR